MLDVIESLLLFLWGVVRRFWFWLPPLLLDPMDAAERLFGVIYEVPQVVGWSLFGVGLFVAALFTYHDERMRSERLADRLADERAPSIPLWVAREQQDAVTWLARYFGMGHHLISLRITEEQYPEWLKQAEQWQGSVLHHMRSYFSEMEAQRVMHVTTRTTRVWKHAVSDDHDRVCQQLQAQAAILVEFDQQYR